MVSRGGVEPFCGDLAEAKRQHGAVNEARNAAAMAALASQ
jgi:hypothetical protein